MVKVLPTNHAVCRKSSLGGNFHDAKITVRKHNSCCLQLVCHIARSKDSTYLGKKKPNKYHCHKKIREAKESVFQSNYVLMKANAKGNLGVKYLSHVHLGTTFLHVNVSTKDHLSQITSFRKQKRQDTWREIAFAFICLATSF